MSEDEIDYNEFWLSAYREVVNSGKPNHLGCKIQVNNKWDFEYLQEKLQNYHDKGVINFFKYGWPLNAQDTSKQESIPPNQTGARENVDKVQGYLRAERRVGSVIGPFRTNPFGGNVRISPLDTRKKESDDLRVILNLSYPF